VGEEARPPRLQEKRRADRKDLFSFGKEGPACTRIAFCFCPTTAANVSKPPAARLRSLLGRHLVVIILFGSLPASTS
jgi:hypothetical protein